MRIALLTGLLLATPALALGPIPPGTYAGPFTCSDATGQASPAEQQTLIVGENTLRWGDTLKELTPAGPGFYKVRHYALHGDEKVLTGLGTAYVTAGGIHFKMMIDIGPVVVEGEDTFAYHDRRIALISSAGGYRCEAAYTLKR